MYIGRAIGPDQPPYVIAELSANHLGSLDRALAIVDAAAAAGCATPIKLQTFVPASMTLDPGATDFRIVGGPWAGRTLWDLYDEAQDAVGLARGPVRARAAARPGGVLDSVRRRRGRAPRRARRAGVQGRVVRAGRSRADRRRWRPPASR
jgi:hypothetical protein